MELGVIFSLGLYILKLSFINMDKWPHYGLIKLDSSQEKSLYLNNRITRWCCCPMQRRLPELCLARAVRAGVLPIPGWNGLQICHALYNLKKYFADSWFILQRSDSLSELRKISLCGSFRGNSIWKLTLVTLISLCAHESTLHKHSHIWVNRTMFPLFRTFIQQP